MNGQLGMFDPKTEKFKFWNTPDPVRSAPAGGTDYHYNLFVDRAGNAGKRDTVFISGSNSDSIIAFDPESEAFTTYRAPTSGFFMRELEVFDGAVWTVYSNDPAKHVKKDADQDVPVPKLVRLDILKK